MSSSNKSSKGNEPSHLDPDAVKNKTFNKDRHDLEQIRQSLAKRSLNVKFDLDGSDYKAIENIGAGAYGVVCSAIHKKSGDRVAIKKTTHVFEVLTVAKRTFREIKILKHFKHDNIISIREILQPKEDVKSFKDIYIVFDLMESDLHHIIYSRQSLSEEHVRYFLYQILRGLKYIHSANVVHRDLKPSNLLVNEDCHLRIGDFGMARGIIYTPDEPSYYMTQYVATRWYRAPEILLSMLEYGTAVDMWSVGCIFAEMMGRKHLFPGKDYMSQVKLILGVLGTPPDSLMKSSQNDILKRIIKSFGKKAPEPWVKLFPTASKKSLDLLSKMLVLNPAERITVDQGLSHRLLNHYHDPEDEPICVPAFNFDFEKKEMDMPCLRSTIMKEIMFFHRPKPPSLSFSAFLRPAPKEESKMAVKQEGDSEKLSDKIFTEPASLRQTDSEGESSDKPLVTVAAANTETPGEKIKTSSSKKSSPVSIMTSKSQLAPPCIDIEMLSAQSQDGMDMQTLLEDAAIHPPKESTPEKPPKEIKSGAEKKGGNTISEDTKALVKQALLNATQRRQRAESYGEEVDKSKPVTAAQRQKEREEKRRKKKERAKEKIKKTKDKKVRGEQTVSLSSEDVQLLQRWMGMQTHDDPSLPHPDPSFSPPQINSNNNNNNIGTNSSSNANAPGTAGQEPVVCKPSFKPYFIKSSSKHRHILAKTFISSNQISAGNSMLISSSQVNTVPSTFIPVIAVPSTTNPGKLEIKRIVHTAHQSSSHSVSEASNSSSNSRNSSTSTLASDATKSLLQNAILLRNSNSGASNFPSAVNPHPSVGTAKVSETKPSFVFQSGNENSTPPHEQGRASSSSQSNPGNADEKAGRKSDVLLSFPLKEMQESATAKPQSENITAVADSSHAHPSPDILDFFTIKSPSDSPPCFDSPSFPSTDLTTGNNSRDRNSFTSLTFNPSPPYTFQQSPERLNSTDSGNSVSTFPKGSLGENASSPQNSGGQSDPAGHVHYGSPDIFHAGHANGDNNNISNFAPIPFQARDSSSLQQAVVSMQDPSSSIAYSSSSQVTHEDMLFTEGNQSGLSPSFVPGLSVVEDTSSSLSTSPFQQGVCFQHSNTHNNHSAIQTEHQPMVFQQSHLSQSPQQQAFAGNPPHTSFSVSTPQEATTSPPLVPTTSSDAPLFSHLSENFDFHSNSNPSPHFDFLSQHQQQQQQQQHDHRNTLIQHIQHHHHHEQQEQSHTFSQQQQQQHQQQQHMFSQEPQSFPQQQQSQHFPHPSHYHHLQQQQQHQQHYLPTDMYGSSSDSHDPRSLMTTDPGMSVPFSLNNPMNLPFSSTSSVAESQAPYYDGATHRKNYSSTSGKGVKLTVDTSKDKNHLRDPSKDLIAMLSKQMSKSQVVDNFPPVLALTPKGTGAGYGLGMDLDSILTDAQDNNMSMKVEQSPLSSSLLADWLDVSNISQADIEALEQELALQSPMHVSYNDVNL